MATVYELEAWSQALGRQLDSLLADGPDDGEDEEAFLARVDGQVSAALESFGDQVADKVDALDWVMRLQQAMQDRIRKDETALANRRRRAARAEGRIKGLLLRLLEANERLTGEARVRTDRTTAFLRKNARLAGPDSIEDWPDDLVVETVQRRPDRAGALKRIKAGEDIPGFSLHTSRSVQCRR